ncbi:hypothetical protein CVT26_004797 [Gymnopilus dilepis]|uniref:Fibronectin type-III domain-containing protein n=1 Tax=Gymnopilus dilepis TaxID=231916 RepID=A0A409XZG3_9AGAR|nr:hypothetical protein CVT26_004797 [Gymnopilus dilepis]
MGARTTFRNVFTSFLIILCSLHCGVLAADSPYLKPGFQFVYDNPDQSLPIPVTSQCESIRLRWSRNGNSTGPSPVAPYFLQVYHSASNVPYFVPAGLGPTFDWQVPFAPNTQYQICMSDVNGISGGCQQMYTMVPNANVSSPTCQNLTAPPSLPVSARVPLGVMSQFSYIDQCTSLSVTPTSGDPPFTLTIAPDFHPIFNVTSKSRSTMNWQVALPIGFRFFIALESGDGQMWANGPLQVGGLGSSDCLAPGSMQVTNPSSVVSFFLTTHCRSKTLFEKIIIGTSVGGVFVGAFAGILGYILLMRVLRKRKFSPSQSYLASAYAARNNETRPLRGAPSTISYSAYSAPTISSMPISTMPAVPLPSTPPPRSMDLPLEPVRHGRPSVRRSPSFDPFAASSDTESVFSRAQSQPPSTDYPQDVKRPLPPSPGPTASLSSETTSLSSSSNSVSRRQRPLSIQSRAPTYVTVTRPSNLREPVRAINETEDDQPSPDVPPEYGRHTADPSLTYAPSILSSGNRF